MLDVDQYESSRSPDCSGSRPVPVPVQAPSAYQGVRAALRNSYSLPPLSEEYLRLLALLK
jgi:hypothetical protein